MRKISEYDMKQLPAGTVFMICKPNWAFNSIYIKAEGRVRYDEHFKAKYLFQAPNTPEIYTVVNSESFLLLEPEDLERVIRLAQDSLDNYNTVMRKVESMKYRFVDNADLLTTPLFYDDAVMNGDPISEITNPPIRVVGVQCRSDGKHNITLEGGRRKNNVDLQRLLVAKV